jgi:O-succinylbenzoic acid--CoA ligase
LEAIRSSAFWEDGGSVAFRTSGSTGKAAGIVIGKDALMVSALAVNDWLDVDRGSVWGLALPLDHVGGFGVAARAHAAGCGFSHFEGKWDAGRFTEWVGRDGITHVSLVPTQVHDLLAAGLKGGPSLRAVVVGGGRLADETGQAARDAGWPVLASYGMTEASSQVATQRIGGLGQPFADCPLELLPGWDAEVTQEGLLRLKGKALFSGTWDEGCLTMRKGDWFTTNDRAELSGRTIRHLGRADTMVKVMGELVDVEAVERRLIGFCGNRADGVAVVAVPDGRKENSLLAVFEESVRAEAVEEYNSHAPGPERISRWCVVGGFPRTELGKLRRAELAESMRMGAALRHP